MNIFRSTILVSSIAIIGAASTAYVPMGCGCESIDKPVARALGTDPDKNELENPVIVLHALQRKFAHSKVQISELGGEQHCYETDAGPIVCVYWLWSKPGYMKALIVSVSITGDYRYSSSRVSYLELPNP